MEGVPEGPMISPRDRTTAESGHILITGTGRAGTTLLVRYFAALGFDTGFAADEAVDTISNAGLERLPDGSVLPYVIKSPYYASSLGAIIDRRALTIKCCIVPVRRLFDAAESRRRVRHEAERAGRDPGGQPGTIVGTTNPAEQENALAAQLYELIEACARHATPLHLLHFPTFAESHAHLYAGLRPILDEHGVAEAESVKAHKTVSDVRMIHKFVEGAP
jgi:hypothetical protein